MQKKFENCSECIKENKIIKNEYDVVSKTYYKVIVEKQKKILCYRHWHQSKQPKFIQKGSYWEIID